MCAKYYCSRSVGPTVQPAEGKQTHMDGTENITSSTNMVVKKITTNVLLFTGVIIDREAGR